MKNKNLLFCLNSDSSIFRATRLVFELREAGPRPPDHPEKKHAIANESTFVPEKTSEQAKIEMARRAYSKIDQKLQDAKEFAEKNIYGKEGPFTPYTTMRKVVQSALVDFGRDAINYGLTAEEKKLVFPNQNSTVNFLTSVYPPGLSANARSLDDTNCWVVTMKSNPKGYKVEAKYLGYGYARESDVSKAPKANHETKDRKPEELRIELGKKAKTALGHYKDEMTLGKHEDMNGVVIRDKLNSYVGDAYDRMTVTEKASLSNFKLPFASSLLPRSGPANQPSINFYMNNFSIWMPGYDR